MANFVNVFFLGALVAHKDKTVATPRHKLKWLCERWTSLEVLSFRILSEGNFRSEFDPFEVTCVLSVLSSELVFMTGSRYCSFGFGQFSFWSYVIVWFLTRRTNKAAVIWNAAGGGAISVAATNATSVNYSRKSPFRVRCHFLLHRTTFSCHCSSPFRDYPPFGFCW